MKPASTIMGLTLAIFFAYSTLGCPPTPSPVTPTNDASDAALPILTDATGPLAPDDADAAGSKSACARACVKLASLGCPEAQTPEGGLSCSLVCSNADANGHFDLKPACIAAAKDVAAVRKCGSVRCLGK